MYKVPDGRTSYFDCDDTLVMWSIPADFPDDELVELECHGLVDKLAPNKYNVDLLKKFASRGHYVVVWSAGGADWAETVVKGLGLEKYVQVAMGKPDYFIDDISNPREWMGKHGYFDIEGNRQGSKALFHNKDEIDE